MALLNKEAYRMEPDGLVYDSRHPVDAMTVTVTVAPETPGEIARGQVIDVTEEGYEVHKEEGTPSAIAAETVSYAQDDTEIPVTVYVSGTFHAGRVLADPELTEKDREILRGKGIYLK